VREIKGAKVKALKKISKKIKKVLTSKRKNAIMYLQGKEITPYQNQSKERGVSYDKQDY